MAIRKGIHHVAMNVVDFEGTIRFYTEALGCSLLRKWPVESPGAAMLDAGGSIIEIFQKEAVTTDEKAVIPHFALVSDDVDGDYRRALEFGAKPHIEPTDTVIHSDPEVSVRIAFFVGINGELVELFQER